MTEKQKNFVKGAAILSIAGLIAKVIGAFFRVPMTNAIGSEGMGYYQIAYPTYALLLMMSTAGLPVAVSKLVSERLANDDYAGAYNTFRVARRVLLILGIIMAIVMFALAKPLSVFKETEPAVYSLMALAPALFFVPVMSAYRGYFQGMQYMVPTAISQVLEQVVKLGAGLSFAYAFYSTTGRPELGAMGALLGVTLSEAVALLYMMLVYGKRKRLVLSHIPLEKQKGPVRDFKPILKTVVMIAIPVTLGACVMPIVNEIDSYIVPTSLKAMGYAQKEATSMFGLLAGVVNPLINLPAVLSLSLSMSLVPAISRAISRKSGREIKMNASFGFKLAFIVGLPSATLFVILARQIILFLYKRVAEEGNLDTATLLLQIMSVGVLFLTIIQTMTGILQGLGKPILPVISLIVGAVVKIAVSVTLIRQPDINVYGAAIGTVVCYMIAAVIDVLFVLKKSKFRFSLLNHILKPIAATAVMGVCAYFVYRLLGGFSNSVGVLAAILIGLVVYLLVLLMVRGLSREELAMVPGGGKLERLMKKMRVWK